MAKIPKRLLKLDLASALKRKKAQAKKEMSLPLLKKMALMDRLHSNAKFLKSLRPKVVRQGRS